MAEEQTIDIPGVGPVTFPASMSDVDVSAAAKRLYDEANGPKAHANDPSRLPARPETTEANTPKSFGGFVSNAVEDAKGLTSALDPRNWPGMVQGMVAAKNAEEARMTDAIMPGHKNRVGFSTPGDRLGAQLKEIPGMIYEKPVSSALAVAPGIKPGLAALDEAAPTISDAVRRAGSKAAAVARHPATHAVAGGIYGLMTGGPVKAIEYATGGGIVGRITDALSAGKKVAPTIEDELGVTNPAAVAARKAVGVDTDADVPPNAIDLGANRGRGGDPIVTPSPPANPNAGGKLGGKAATINDALNDALDAAAKPQTPAVVDIRPSHPSGGEATTPVKDNSYTAKRTGEDPTSGPKPEPPATPTPTPAKSGPTPTGPPAGAEDLVPSHETGGGPTGASRDLLNKLYETLLHSQKGPANGGVYPAGEAGATALRDSKSMLDEAYDTANSDPAAEASVIEKIRQEMAKRGKKK